MRQGENRHSHQLFLCGVSCQAQDYQNRWIGFGIIPAAGAVADARDTVQALINGDELGAAMNAAGIFSGIGDGVKTIFAVGLFVRKTGKAAEVAEVLAKYALKEVPNAAVVRQVLDELFEGAATRLVGEYGDDIYRI